MLRLLKRFSKRTQQPSVQLDVARLAAKRGDAELFGRMMNGFKEQSGAWPLEAQEQFRAVEAAAAGGNPRPAAPRVQFLRNVLVRVPEYRQGRLAVQDPPEILSEPFTRPFRMEAPPSRPSPPDESLAFEVETPEGFGASAWGGAVHLSGDGTPALVFADGREARLGGGIKLLFPGGPGATPPPPNAVAGLDFDYDFKTDLALAGEGGLRLYRQESATSFADVTAKAALPPDVAGAPYAGVWAADIEADGDLDIVLGAKEGAPVVLRNNGDGGFDVQRPFEGVSALRDFVWADLDGDGDPDAALLDVQGRLNVFTNERTGQFARAQRRRTGGQLVRARRGGRERRRASPARASERRPSARLRDKGEGANGMRLMFCAMRMLQPDDCMRAACVSSPPTSTTTAGLTCSPLTLRARTLG